MIVPFDIALCETWARVRARSRALGRQFEIGDAWIAATTVQLSFPLYAEDRDFVGLAMPGLEVRCLTL